MGDRLDGRVAVITGAGQGIGRGVARRFAREGCAIVVAEINDDSGPETVRQVEELGSQAVFLRTDVSDETQARACVQAAISEYGRVDILVNNAWGGAPGGRIEWHTADQLRRTMDVSFYSGLWTMQEAFPHMKFAGVGSIINLCSLNGVNAHMYSVAYNTAKEALRTLSRTAAVEWGQYNIRTNVICPAAASEAYQNYAAANPANVAKMLEENPMRRMGDAENDIGGAALFLASDDSAYVNGSTLFVSGGTHINGVSWHPDMPDERPERWG